MIGSCFGNFTVNEKTFWAYFLKKGETPSREYDHQLSSICQKCENSEKNLKKSFKGKVKARFNFYFFDTEDRQFKTSFKKSKIVTLMFAMEKMPI